MMQHVNTKLAPVTIQDVVLLVDTRLMESDLLLHCVYLLVNPMYMAVYTIWHAGQILHQCPIASGEDL